LPFLSSRPCFAFTGSFGVLILQTMLPWIQTGSYPAGQADAGCARAAKPPIATTAAISFDFMGALLWVRDASASPTVGRAVRLKGSTRFGPKRAAFPGARTLHPALTTGMKKRMGFAERPCW